MKMHSRGEKNKVDTGGEKWNEVQIMGLESKTVSQVKKCPSGGENLQTR